MTGVEKTLAEARGSENRENTTLKTISRTICKIPGRGVTSNAVLGAWRFAVNEAAAHCSLVFSARKHAQHIVRVNAEAGRSWESCYATQTTIDVSESTLLKKNTLAHFFFKFCTRAGSKSAFAASASPTLH